MPGKDGTGPVGNGPRGGVGRRGRMGGPQNAGPEGICVCPKCGAEVAHDRAKPCSEMKCPACGTPMVRA